MSQLITKGLQDASVTNAKVASGIDAVKLADGSVTNAELQFINSLTSNAQDQLDGKASIALNNLSLVSINDNLNPDGDATRSLGNGSAVWAVTYSESFSSGQRTELFVEAPNGTISVFSNSEDLSLKTYNFVVAPSFKLWNAANTFNAAIKAPNALAASYTLTLPPNDGNSGQVLSTDGSGVTSWITPSGSTPDKETFTLVSGDITNQYIDLGFVAITDSIHFIVKGLGPLLEGASHDYSVSYTGGAGGNTRITFLNDIATGGGSALIAGDVVQVAYLR